MGSGIERGKMSAMSAIDVGVLDNASTHMTIYSRFHLCQAGATLPAEWITCFRQSFSAVRTEFGL